MKEYTVIMPIYAVYAYIDVNTCKSDESDVSENYIRVVIHEAYEFIKDVYSENLSLLIDKDRIKIRGMKEVTFNRHIDGEWVGQRGYEFALKIPFQPYVVKVVGDSKRQALLSAEKEILSLQQNEDDSPYVFIKKHKIRIHKIVAEV